MKPHFRFDFRTKVIGRKQFKQSGGNRRITLCNFRKSNVASLVEVRFLMKSSDMAGFSLDAEPFLGSDSLDAEPFLGNDSLDAEPFQMFPQVRCECSGVKFPTDEDSSDPLVYIGES